MDDPNLPNADPNSNAAKALRGTSSDTQFVFGIITRRLRPNVIQNRIDNFDPNNQYGITSSSFPLEICEDGSPEPCLVNGTPVPPVFAEITDWERGVTGWDILLEVNAPDRFGACRNASNSYVITDFQQNPCVIYEWVLEHPAASNVGDVGTLKTTEQEEAGADMFLNWVYRTVEGGASQAFGDNLSLQQQPTGRQFTNCSVTPSGHGDDRFCWMQENLRLFFQYYGW
jgi:predicted secreted protein